MDQMMADSSQELQVPSVTRSTEFIVNNVEQTVLEMEGMLSTVL